ncbi:MAG: hypothetical protein MRECE_38c020 [Mycoplasmataceae bacterium CE_OT135]|nr:MAG: hypothetical protein MRECE_38c020 [Mycoplasmataceae bacterium CE_OT135]
MLIIKMTTKYWVKDSKNTAYVQNVINQTPEISGVNLVMLLVYNKALLNEPAITLKSMNSSKNIN